MVNYRYNMLGRQKTGQKLKRRFYALEYTKTFVHFHFPQNWRMSFAHAPVACRVMSEPMAYIWPELAVKTVSNWTNKREEANNGVKNILYLSHWVNVPSFIRMKYVIVSSRIWRAGWIRHQSKSFINSKSTLKVLGVLDWAQNRLGFECHDLELHGLANISEDWNVFRLFSYSLEIEGSSCSFEDGLFLRCTWN